MKQYIIRYDVTYEGIITAESEPDARQLLEDRDYYPEQSRWLHTRISSSGERLGDCCKNCRFWKHFGSWPSDKGQGNCRVDNAQIEINEHRWCSKHCRREDEL